MGDRVPKTFSIDEETLRIIKRIGEITHRADSHLIDLWASEAWRKMNLPRTDPPTEENNFAGLREE